MCHVEDLDLPDKAYLFSLLINDMWPFIALSHFNRLGKESRIQPEQNIMGPTLLREHPASHSHPACFSPWQAAWGKKAIFCHTPM